MSNDGLNISTGDPEVDAILAGQGVPATALAQPNDIAGGMWSGPTSPIDPETGEFVGPVAQTSPDGIGNYYSADYVNTLWKGLPLEDRIRLQDSLVTLGLTRAAIPGEFDDGTISGITQLLSLSNRSGTTWRATIGRLRDLESKGLLAAQESAQEYEPRIYLQPDYASIAEDVKAIVRERLNRDPDRYEMQQLAGELSGFYALEHEAATEFEQLQHEQQTTPGVQAPGPVSRVDPLSRFKQLFEKKYAHELDFVEDKKDAIRSREAVDAAVNLASNMSKRQG